MKLISIVSLAASIFGAVSAKNCAKCAPTIFYSGQTRTLTFTLQSTSSTLGPTAQCNYDSPPISGFSPACLYSNLDGSLVFTNTGGACPILAPIVVVSSTATCDAHP